MTDNFDHLLDPPAPKPCQNCKGDGMVSVGPGIPLPCSWCSGEGVETAFGRQLAAEIKAQIALDKERGK